MAKTILITGASSGFGRLTAEKLANSGHRVFAGFRSTDGAKKPVADELRGKKIEILRLDVTDQASIDSAVKQLLKTTNNQLDVVVNNAGMASAGISESFTAEQVREMFDVNVFGVQRVIRATLPALRAQRSPHHRGALQGTRPGLPRCRHHRPAFGDRGALHQGDADHVIAVVDAGMGNLRDGWPDVFASSSNRNALCVPRVPPVRFLARRLGRFRHRQIRDRGAHPRRPHSRRLRLA